MSDPSPAVRLARLYRMLFHYETDPDADYAPAYITAMGELDCLWAIARLENGNDGKISGS